MFQFCRNNCLNMNSLLVSFLCLIFMFNTVWQAEVRGERKLDFTMSSKKNQTGHWETNFSVDKTSRKLPNAWKVNVKHYSDEKDGLMSLHLRGTLAIPPPIPADYELFQGIGYYKLHTSADSFDEASSICSKEGGHLAIVNSEAESAVLQTLYKRNPALPAFAYVGFHDRLKEGEFITIFGKPLISTGFNRWSGPNEPNGGTRENCGTLHSNGGLNDNGCNAKLPFFCEYDLSWADS